MTNTTFNNALGIVEPSLFTKTMRETTQLSRLSLIQKRVPKHIINQLNTSLNSVNGRRRIRTLELDDILHAMRQAVKTDCVSHDHGGTVANCYGYAAYATAVLAFTIGRFLYLEIKLADASRGSTGFGQVNRFNNPSNREKYLMNTYSGEPAWSNLNCHLFLLTGK